MTKLDQGDTDRKGVEKTLVETNQLLGAIFDHNHVLIAYLDPQFKFIRVNWAYAEADEREVSFFPGKNYFDLYPSEENEAIFKHVVETGEPYFSAAKSFEHPERGVSYWDRSLIPIRDSSGAVTGLVITLTDITECKRAEEALRKSESRLRTIMANIPLVMWAIDNNGLVTNSAGKGLKVLGFEPDEIVGQSLFDLYRDEPQIQENHRRALKGEAFHADVEIAGLVFDCWHEPIQNENGEVTGVIGVAIDITERKLAEEKLELFNQIISHIDNLVLVADKRGRIIFAGPSITRVFDYPMQEVLGNGWFESAFRDDSEREKEIADIVAAIEDKNKIKTEPYERRIYDKEGKVRWVLWQDTAGPGNTLIEIGHDITEYKNLEAQLLQGEKMRAVGELAAGIAHEINSPIQFIGDNLRFLEEATQKTTDMLEDLKQPEEIVGGYNHLSGVIDPQSNDPSTDDIDYYIEEIPKAIKQSLDGVSRISEIVQAMRTFSHPGGKEKTTIDINQALQSTITVSRNEWRYAADLRIDLDPDLPPVSCLAGEINQVFLNLILNAAQAVQEAQDNGVSRGKGTISISTRKKGDAVEVRISDTGAGIPAEIRSRIFEPFFTTKGVGRGTGQGLAIAHSVVVESHGGGIDFETERGKGTTFIIHLPLEHSSGNEEE